MEQSNWQKSIIEKVLLETIKEQRRSRRWRIFFRLLWLIIFLAIIYIFFFHDKGIDGTKPVVAVVDLKDEISLENKTYKTVAYGIEDALKSKRVVGVIIRANSPGGSPVYSDMLYQEIMRLRTAYPKKPIDVVVEEMCASGCYYIAAAANKIYARPASIVGSIGVIYAGFGFTGLMQKIGVDNRLQTAGRNKGMNYPFSPVNKEQESMQQQMLDEVHQQFITAVVSGRGNRLKTSEPDLFSGRYWVGSQALKLGLIDGYATVRGLAKEKYKTDELINYTPKDEFFDSVARKFGLSVMMGAKQAITANDTTTMR